MRQPAGWGRRARGTMLATMLATTVAGAIAGLAPEVAADSSAATFKTGEAITVRGGPVFNRLAAAARREGWEHLPMGELVRRIGLELRGARYEAGTLDRNPGHELCVVNLETFDCVTFVENTLAFARMWKAGGRSMRDLAAELEEIRYRDGKRDGYVSRLHYTTEWLADNARRGILRDLGGDLPGAAPFVPRLGFMSAHPGSYPALVAHPEWVVLITAREAALSADTSRYVPREGVADAAGRFESGDIVAFTTAVPGLDTSHLGFVVREEGGAPRLLHASTTTHEVTLDVPLAAYVEGKKKVTGILAARPLELAPR